MVAKNDIVTIANPITVGRIRPMEDPMAAYTPRSSRSRLRCDYRPCDVARLYGHTDCDPLMGMCLLGFTE
jgi:hypothetical protein